MHCFSACSGSHSLKWITPPRTILLVKKQEDLRTLEAAENVIKHIRHTYPDIRILVEEELVNQLGVNIKNEIVVLNKGEFLV